MGALAGWEGWVGAHFWAAAEEAEGRAGEGAAGSAGEAERRAAEGDWDSAATAEQPARAAQLPAPTAGQTHASAI